MIEPSDDVRRAFEVVRAGARRMCVLGWERSAADLLRALETIEAGFVGQPSFYGLRGALAELEDARSFNATEKAMVRVIDHAKALAWAGAAA